MDHDLEDRVLMGEEENIFAHMIAKEALKANEGHYLDGGVSEHVRRALEKRRQRAPN
ncbi:hypothetical protein PVK06_030790 [Gossypium arboreum]|uniref:Uncharacterized protein n=1 Tax=Gossypium arboreum TaxID=29729 RepID=A0ABR0NPS5_GOSAR|nr:hypothetical protein PVK06_030790 [Gossypium arboreum]